MSPRINFDRRALRAAALEVRRVRGAFTQFEHGEEVFQDWLYENFSTDDIRNLLSCWQLYARDSQLRPEICNPIWLRQAGRGEGKTRSAAEYTLDLCEDWGRIAKGIIGSKTIGDVRQVMIHGESGLMECARKRGYKLDYKVSYKTVYHPSGAELYLVTSEKPDGPRGLQCNIFWLDEISSWMNPIDIFNNIILAWRLPVPEGEERRGVVTTTPKPNPISYRLIKDEKFSHMVTISRGRTADNRDNLDQDTVAQLESIYEGTRIGRQELDGELLDSLGVTVTQDIIHEFRVRSPPELSRRIVSLDPSIDDKDTSDDAGIVVLGSDYQNPADAYLLADYSLEQASFGAWATQTVKAFDMWDCDCVVAEINQGGKGIPEAIQVAAERLSKEWGRELVVPVVSVWAKESKQARAEPVGALYERGRVHHVGYFKAAESELTSWLPGMPSPNILDAIVHGISHLLLGDKTVGPLRSYYSP